MPARSAAGLAVCFALLAPAAIAGEVAENRLDIPQIGHAAELYARHCQGCHGHEGVSVAEVPTLRNRVGWFLHTAEGRDYVVRVPGVALALVSDSELATILNWMLEVYSRDELPRNWRVFTASEVARLRSEPLSRVSEERADIVDQLVANGVIPGRETLEFGPEPDR